MAAAAPCDQMDAIFNLLEAERARMNNLPDEEFTDAYMNFRGRVENIVREYTEFLNVGFLKFGDWIAKGFSWVTDFFSGEGFDQIPRESGTFTLDPAPFKDMIQEIMKYSRPDHEDTCSSEQKLSDCSKLKNFAKGSIKVIANYGVSQACAQKYLYEGVVNILDSIDLKNEKQIVNIDKNSHSLEVKKVGTVVIASYVYGFHGQIEKGCCYDSQLVTMRLKYKIWKFSTLAELKKEYVKIHRK